VRRRGDRLRGGLALFDLGSLRFKPRGLFRRRLSGLVGFRYFESIEPAQLYRHVFVDGAGVRLLLDHAQFGEPVQYFMGLHFQLPRQLVNSNLSHRQS
jgi:hypothetical protein